MGGRPSELRGSGALDCVRRTRSGSPVHGRCSLGIIASGTGSAAAGFAAAPGRALRWCRAVASAQPDEMLLMAIHSIWTTCAWAGSGTLRTSATTRRGRIALTLPRFAQAFLRNAPDQRSALRRAISAEGEQISGAAGGGHHDAAAPSSGHRDLCSVSAAASWFAAAAAAPSRQPADPQKCDGKRRALGTMNHYACIMDC